MSRTKGKVKKSKPKCGCRKSKIFHKVRGSIRSVKGYKKKSCFK